MRPDAVGDRRRVGSRSISASSSSAAPSPPPGPAGSDIFVCYPLSSIGPAAPSRRERVHNRDASSARPPREAQDSVTLEARALHGPRSVLPRAPSKRIRCPLAGARSAPAERQEPPPSICYSPAKSSKIHGTDRRRVRRRRRQHKACRGVAQPGRALRSGRRGRRFKSYHPDHFPFPLPAGPGLAGRLHSPRSGHCGTSTTSARPSAARRTAHCDRRYSPAWPEGDSQSVKKASRSSTSIACPRPTIPPSILPDDTSARLSTKGIVFSVRT